MTNLNAVLGLIQGLTEFPLFQLWASCNFSKFARLSDSEQYITLIYFYLGTLIWFVFTGKTYGAIVSF